jgi:uncharacterized protein with HEPN domain
VLVGIGSKEQRYKEWLKKEFESNNQFINFVARLVDIGEEHGHIALLVRSKINAFQVTAMRDFLVENYETIKMMIPYLKQGMVGKKKNLEDLTDEERSIMNNGNTMTLGQLPESDRNQILELMRQAEEQSQPQVTPESAVETETPTNSN